jgi:glutamate formiminotransferase/formiminotetrahydrofolate cyclodeaminase
MARVVECVPNFSEGRRREVVDSIVESMIAVEGVKLLDREMDVDHNRCVITIAGGPEPVEEAAFRGASKAVELIDLRVHTGEHPRMGAVDVIPFVPISDFYLDDCVAMARRVAARIGDELKLPAFLYEAAATKPERENLADVRRGQFEGLSKAIGRDEDRRPDFGPNAIHKSAGAVAVGARMPLVAFNVNLGTSDIRIARRIADSIRDRSGGFRFAKALGFALHDRGIVQVSMNLVNTLRTPVHRVFNMIKIEAERWGVPIVGSEIVGLVPQSPMLDVAEHYLRLETFSKEQVLETRLSAVPPGTQASTWDFLNEVASRKPAPGGGSVSALAGSLSAALGIMVVNLTIGKLKFKPVKSELSALKHELEPIRRELSDLVVRDAEAFDAVMTASALPEVTEKEKKRRKEALAAAAIGAARVPLEVARLSIKAMEGALVVANKGNPNSLSDAGVAGLTGFTAVKGAIYNVYINLPSIEAGKERNKMKSEANALFAKADDLLGRIREKVEGDLLRGI